MPLKDSPLIFMYYFTLNMLQSLILEDSILEDTSLYCPFLCRVRPLIHQLIVLEFFLIWCFSQYFLMLATLSNFLKNYQEYLQVYLKRTF